MPARSFDVFLSYNREDEELVRELAAALKQREITYWRDREQLRPGFPWQDGLHKGIEESSAAAILIGQGGFENWQLEELREWIDRAATEKRVAVIPVFLPGAPEDARPPGFLRQRTWVDLRPTLSREGLDDLEFGITGKRPEQETGSSITPQAELARFERYAEAWRTQYWDGCNVPSELEDQTRRALDVIRQALERPPEVRWHGRQVPQSPSFVGREAELWRLHLELESNRTVAVQSQSPTQVRGMGGIGKTFLVEEYANRFALLFPGGLFWLDAAGALSEHGTAGDSIGRADQFLAIARGLGIPQEIIDPEHPEEAVRKAIADRERSLWIVDDIPAGLAPQEFEAWLAPASVLLTTRSTDYEDRVLSFPLELLSPQDALALLTSKKAPADPSEEEVARSLCDDLGYHALALAVAGSAIERWGESYQEFHHSLSASDQAALLEDAARDIQGQLPTGHERSILKTLERSLSSLGEEGRDLLLLAASFSPLPIPSRVFEATLEEDPGQRDIAQRIRRRAWEQVQSLSLAEPAGSSSLGVHGLVSMAIRHLGSRDRMLELRSAAVAALSKRLVDVGDIRKHDALAMEVALVRGIVNQARTAQEATLLSRVARYDHVRGAYASSCQLYEQVLEIRRRVLGEENLSTLSAMELLAQALRHVGDLEGARQLSIQVLEINRRELSEEHPNALLSMNNLAQTLSALGDLEGAQKLYEQALEAERRVLGEEHLQTVNSTSCLGVLLEERGDFKGARQLHEQALEAYQRIEGEEHPHTLTSMNNLASTLQRVGDLEGARQLHEQVFEVRRRVLGEEHPHTLNSMNNLAETLRNVGDFESARQLQEQTLETRRRVLGEEHPRTLTSMNNLALILGELGDLEGARQLHEQALEAKRRVLGEEHPLTLLSMNNLAAALHDQGILDDARKINETVLEARRMVLGEEHPDTLRSMNNLARTLSNLGDHEGARRLHEQQLLACRKVQGEEHPSTLSSKSSLATELWYLGDLENARKLEEQVVEAQRRLLGEEHPSTLLSKSNLATTLQDLGKLEDAREIHEEVLKARRQLLGEKHPDTIESMKNLALTLSALGENEAARAIVSDALAKARTSLTEGVPVRVALEKLAAQLEN